MAQVYPAAERKVEPDENTCYSIYLNPGTTSRECGSLPPCCSPSVLLSMYTACAALSCSKASISRFSRARFHRWLRGSTSQRGQYGRACGGEEQTRSFTADSHRASDDGHAKHRDSDTEAVMVAGTPSSWVDVRPADISQLAVRWVQTGTSVPLISHRWETTRRRPVVDSSPQTHEKQLM